PPATWSPASSRRASATTSATSPSIPRRATSASSSSRSRNGNRAGPAWQTASRSWAADRRLLDHRQDVALAHWLAFSAADLLHRPRRRGFHRHLHLHRLEDDDGLPGLHCLARLLLDLPDGAGDVGRNVHRASLAFR